jgi:hypothetical protein
MLVAEEEARIMVLLERGVQAVAEQVEMLHQKLVLLVQPILEVAGVARELTEQEEAETEELGERVSLSLRTKLTVQMGYLLRLQVGQ